MEIHGRILGRVVLQSNDRFIGEKVESIRYQVITWNISANNTVVVPTGGCDVSAPDVTSLG